MELPARPPGTATRRCRRGRREQESKQLWRAPTWTTASGRRSVRRSHCAVIKSLAPAAVRCFGAHLLLRACAASSAAFDAEQHVAPGRPPEVPMRCTPQVASCAYRRARQSGSIGIGDEATAARDGPARWAPRADARRAVAEMLAGPTPPPYTDHESAGRARRRTRSHQPPDPRARGRGARSRGGQGAAGMSKTLTAAKRPG